MSAVRTRLHNEKNENRNCAAHENDALDEVGPDYGLEPAERTVDHR